MLSIMVPAVEQYDEVNNTFTMSKPMNLQLEHSLVSLSKWESKHHKPFIGNDPKTLSENIDYVVCMTITQNVPQSVYFSITPEIMEKINEYINDTMTATTFNKREQNKTNREVITSEIIYYWMITLGIPYKFETWHLNRLLTLINVCNLKNSPGRKIGKREQLARQRSINESRLARLGTQG